MRRGQSTISLTIDTNESEHEHDDSTLGEDSPFLFRSASTLNEKNDPVEEAKAQRLRTLVILLIVGLIVSVDLPSVLQLSPTVRIIEDIYCRAYYQENDPSKFGVGGTIEESLCKVDPVQVELAFLKGWMSFFNHLPGLFLAIPFGMMADKYGRKWLLVVNVIQMQLRSCWIYLILYFPNFFPIKLIWLEAALGIFGGGSMVATALIFVIVSDVTPSSQTASTFFRLGASNFLCFLVAPPLAARLMEISPWIPLSLGLVLQAVAIPVTMALPETLGFRKPIDPTPPTPKRFSTNDEKTERPMTATEPSMRLSHGSFSDTARSVLASFMVNSAFLFKDWRILFFGVTYPIRMLASPLGSLLLQYVSKRYQWTLARVTYISSFEAGVSMIALLFLFPSLSSYLLKKKGLNVSRKDLMLARIGVTATAVGIMLTGFAPTIFILFVGMGISSLGSGAGSATRALLTSYVQQNEVARLYTALSIVETLGLTAGGPVVAGLFKMGMENVKSGKYGDAWLGLPYFLVGILLSLVAALMWMLRLADAPREKVEEEGIEDMAIGPATEVEDEFREK
ncbi:hypothetical protein MMC11_003972 [Xylographa trunciseda]|nr:hypothetical protein [Xylographa trunciseda]